MRSRTSSPDRRARGFTLIELVIAGTIAAVVLTALTFSLSQLSKARNIARDRVEAFQRASSALEAMRRDVAATIRSEDLFDTRFLLSTQEATARTGGHERSELLLFNLSMRPTQPIDYQGEGREYETHYRIEDDELGAALWRRRDKVPDEVPDGGGLAEPVADGVVGLLVEASDGQGGWRTEWDSDVDGVPTLVRITVTATGAQPGVDAEAMTPEVDLRTVVAIDRVVAPKEDAPPPEDPAAQPGATGGNAPENAGTPGGAGGAGAPVPTGGGGAPVPIGPGGGPGLGNGTGGGRGNGGMGGGFGGGGMGGGRGGSAPPARGGGFPGGRGGAGGGGGGGGGGGRGRGG